jgi:PAS domain S-box-containing protein
MALYWKDIFRKGHPDLDGMEAARRLSDLYDFAPVGYLTLDPKGHIRESNLTAARLLGVERPLLVNKPFVVFVASGGVRDFMTHLRTSRLEKASSEMALKAACGGTIWARLTSTPVYERGELLIWTVLTDETGRKNAEEELKRHGEHLDELVEVRTGEIKKINARLAEEVFAHEEAEDRIKRLNEELNLHVKLLEEVNRDLEAFNFSLAHDLSTPLRIIDGFTRMLTKYYSDRLDDEGREFIKTIERNARRMTQFIADLLKLSRLGRADIAKTPLDMTALARTVADELRATGGDLAGEAGRKIIFKFHPLPPVLGEETMIRQVFLNLIGNSLKFTRPRETAVIEVGGNTAGRENVYYVRDNGVGFDMAGSDRLFALFRRLHTEKEFEGTGAGLAIVSRIIERHGGRVWAEGRPGEGAAFYFSLPAGQKALPEGRE